MELGSTFPSTLLGWMELGPTFPSIIAGVDGTGFHFSQHIAGVDGTGFHFSQHIAGVDGTGSHFSSSQHIAGVDGTYYISQGMGDMLSSALDASPPKLKSQLHYIITQLHLPSAVANDDIETPPSDDSADEEEEEDDEETDVIEGDEDEVAIATNGPVGEALLARYVITSSSHQMMSLKQVYIYMYIHVYIIYACTCIII